MTAAAYTRDRLTWTGLLAFATYASLASLIGPSVPHLQRELHLSYATVGLHATALALGTLLASVTSDRLTSRFGRERTLLIGGGGALIGLLIFTVPALSGTLLGAFTLGAFGTVLLNTAQALLSARHTERQATAFTEAGVAASVCSSLTALTFALIAGSDASWRVALLVPALLTASVAVLTFTVPSLQARTVPATSRAALPRTFQHLWWATLAVVAVEWSVAFWATEYLTAHATLSPAQAASAFSGYLAALLVGRLTGSWVSRHVRPETLLLSVSALASVGFICFWLATGPLAAVGLLIVGLGVANLYPLMLSLAMIHAGPAGDWASARLSIATGLAILTAPALLGWLADQVDLTLAYLLVPACLLIAAILSRAGTRTRVDSSSSTSWGA